MKKLIIAAAIVCAAAMSQAAALNWASYAYHNDGGADEDWFSGGQGYLVLVTDAANFAVTAGDSGLEITGGTLLTGEGSRNEYDGGYVFGAIDGSAFGAEDGGKYAFAILATDNGTSSALPTDGYYGVDGIYEVTWNKDMGASWDPSEEHMAAVTTQVAPEPTSGLLLLIGVAGLALKRRRA